MFSRETSVLPEDLKRIVKGSSVYHSLFLSENGYCIDSLPVGFLSLALFVHNKEGLMPTLLVSDNESVAHEFYYSLEDVLPGFVKIAVTTEENNSSVFVSENRKNFEEFYVSVLNRENNIFITTKNTLATNIRQGNTADGLQLLSNNYFSQPSLIKTLEAWGYEQADVTNLPRLFSKRGGILDIFPLYASLPLRIEFDGDTIESMREFNPVSQLSINEINRYVLYPPSGCFENDEINVEKFVSGFLKTWLFIKKDGDLITVSNNVGFAGNKIEHGISAVGSFENLRTANNTFVFCTANNKIPIDRELLPETAFVPINLSSGFFVPEDEISVFGLKELGALQSSRKTGSLYTNDIFLPSFNLQNVSWGDLIVHEDYGIGIYRGLVSDIINNQINDFVLIEYADGGYIRVSPEMFHKIHKYLSSGNGTHRLLSTLNRKRWLTEIGKAKKSVDLIVQELIEIYSSRQQIRGRKYFPDNDLLLALKESFPFEETPGQTKAIQDVSTDLEKETPMDRIVLGDVGFGKTEVAIRAAMKAVESGYQVFVVSPTTLLADQHYINFSNRLTPLGVRIRLLSRFQSKKETVCIHESIFQGTVDVLVGTHKLLDKKISSERLGLLIIDEEHRFGVRHKEFIRTLKKSVDVLTLTATPIPRTLQQSLIGVRDISRIDTPPRERLPIKTTVVTFNWSLVKSAIQRELQRGGQVFFLHNDISSIPYILDKISNFFPDRSVAAAHGAMAGRDLEKMLLSFFSGEIDILVCTTIIESGLDVPNANTIIINNAHKLGLSQIYQIRGRVGRGRLQAYCWLMIPNKTLGDDALRRLKTIEHYSALGSGYEIALKDLEIRGAGSVFGYKQSGHVNKIGYDLYCKLLKERVDEFFGKTPHQPTPLRVVFDGSAHLPEKYIPLVQDRLYYYQYLGTANNDGVVEGVEREIKDRYGSLPDEVKNVFSVAKTRVAYTGLPVDMIDINKNGVSIFFNAVFAQKIEINKLSAVAALTGNIFRFENKNNFSLFFETGSSDKSFAVSKTFATMFKQSSLA